MSDLLKFLNKIEGAGYGGTAEFEIARTEARGLREALKPFAEWDKYLKAEWGNAPGDTILFSDDKEFTIRFDDFRRARAALLLAHGGGK